jgi:two-component system response regulator ResD
MMRDARATVLVVDDEPTIGEVVSRYLQRAGYDTRLAGSGEEALEQAAIDSPDLVVLDLMLPGVDGLEVMRRLRQRDRGRTAIILLTARASRAGVGAGRSLNRCVARWQLPLRWPRWPVATC